MGRIKMRTELLYGLAVVMLMVSGACAQDAKILRIDVQNRIGANYQITLEPLKFEGFDGLHSFAAGKHDDEWILFGGRTDGLHRMRPFEAFLARDNNSRIIVLDPATNKSWSAPMMAFLPHFKNSSNLQTCSFTRMAGPCILLADMVIAEPQRTILHTTN